MDTEPEMEPEPEPEMEPEPETEPEMEMDLEMEMDMEMDMEPAPAPAPDTDTDTEPDPETDPEMDPEMEMDMDMEPDMDMEMDMDMEPELKMETNFMTREETWELTLRYWHERTCPACKQVNVTRSLPCPHCKAPSKRLRMINTPRKATPARFKVGRRFKSRSQPGVSYSVMVSRKTGVPVSCSCLGFRFHRHCWHMDHVREKVK